VGLAPPVNFKNMFERENRQPNATQELLVKVIRTLRTHDTLYKQLSNNRRSEKFDTDGSDPRSRDTKASTHAINTYDIARELTAQDEKDWYLNDTEKARLRIAALIHDFGELGPQGDVDYERRTTDHHEEEAGYFLDHVHEFFPDFSEEDTKKIVDIYLEVSQNKNKKGKEAEYFSMIEYIGYCLQMVEEWQEKRDSTDWMKMCPEYMRNIGAKIKQIIKEHPSAKSLLSKPETLKNLSELINWTKKEQKKNPALITEDLLKTWDEIYSILDETQKQQIN
jgi:5'-deoxynucleotidase YfbR-like HD superfamily hydrolase